MSITSPDDRISTYNLVVATTRDVFAFEPQPNMVAFLKAALGSSVRVEQVALSDSAGPGPIPVAESKEI
ncbi:hypothetical protein [Rhizobium leguminosarum]|uniref:hypothetical protein n=1 Tax=Rhizobium leguminosarum TaxID=384 RepID=UPI003F944D0A